MPGKLRTGDTGPLGSGTEREASTAVEIQGVVDFHFLVKGVWRTEG